MLYCVYAAGWSDTSSDHGAKSHHSDGLLLSSKPGVYVMGIYLFKIFHIPSISRSTAANSVSQSE